MSLGGYGRKPAPWTLFFVKLLTSLGNLLPESTDRLPLCDLSKGHHLDRMRMRVRVRVQVGEKGVE